MGYLGSDKSRQFALRDDSRCTSVGCYSFLEFVDAEDCFFGVFEVGSSVMERMDVPIHLIPSSYHIYRELESCCSNYNWVADLNLQSFDSFLIS